MNRDDECRRNAADAQKQSEGAKSIDDKAAWLRIAQGWLSMVRKPKPTDAVKFQQAVDQHGTQQDDSESSH